MPDENFTTQPQSIAPQLPTPAPVQKAARSATGINMYFFLIGAVILVLVGGVVYRQFFLAQGSAPVYSGKTVEFTVVAVKDEWRFIPEEIEVGRGDKVIMTVVNEDEYDHGIAIDSLGVSQRMPANTTIKIEFVATQEGDFPFYCSVPCGEGDTDGSHRTHFDMIGTLKVRNAIQPVSSITPVP